MRFRYRDELESLMFHIDKLPENIKKYLNCKFVTNYNPMFLGISQESRFCYRDGELISHVLFKKYHTNDDCSYLCLFDEDAFIPEVIYHEVAHIIHGEFDIMDHDIIPFNDYAELNWLESWATALQSFLTIHSEYDEIYYPTTKDLFLFDPDSYYFFRYLFDYHPIKLY